MIAKIKTIKQEVWAEARKSFQFIHGLKPVAIQLKPVEWLNFTWKPLHTDESLIWSFSEKSKGFSLRALYASWVNSFWYSFKVSDEKELKTFKRKTVCIRL